MRKFLFIPLLGAIALLGACNPIITEDDPRWSCTTHGNGVCGPIAGITQATKTLHAANGDFPYLILQGYADAVCVYGDNPRTPAHEGDTALACMSLDKVH